MKNLAKWMNAINEAWNRGDAPWAHDEYGSVAVATYNTGGEEAVINLAKVHGIDPKKYRPKRIK